jgi:2-C-methyl-D-erythritol 2,4-cyclodiphosphate synthase
MLGQHEPLSRGHRIDRCGAAQPRLAPHLPAMRARLAAALDNDAVPGNNAALVNVKASNPEGLGALGRGEGMAAAAIVMLQAD